MWQHRAIRCLVSTMDENPYESTHATRVLGRRRPTRWLVWAGATCIVIALICVIASVLGQVYNFNVIAEGGTTPRAQDLARGIYVASLPMLGAVPFGILGAILLIAGFVIRRPVH